MINKPARAPHPTPAMVLKRKHYFSTKDSAIRAATYVTRVSTHSSWGEQPARWGKQHVEVVLPYAVRTNVCSVTFSFQRALKGWMTLPVLENYAWPSCKDTSAVRPLPCCRSYHWYWSECHQDRQPSSVWPPDQLLHSQHLKLRYHFLFFSPFSFCFLLLPSHLTPPPSFPSSLT